MIRGARYSFAWLMVMPFCWGGAVLTGCGPSAQIQLLQPRLTGRQRDLRLVSEQARWATANRVERVLAEFPLPGAATGKPMYLLYLRWPAGETEPAVTNAKSSAARGFLIQTRGQYAGLGSIVGGEVRVSGASQAPNATRQLEVDLTCEDGTRLVGRLRARRDDYYVRYFETNRRPADVQALSQESTDSETKG